MDTNTAKQPTEQKKQELQEKVEQFKEEKTTLPNQAREIMGSTAFEQADKLAQKPLSNDEPLSFEKSFDTNSQAKADELTNIGLESQSQSQNEPYTIIPPDVSEGVKYQKYRNTGVDYFDRKGNLSLLDAYLAKQLGLNVSYNFHKIDMKVDNSTRNINFTKSMNDIREQEAWHNKAVAGVLSVVLQQSGGADEAVQKEISRSPIGGLLNLSASDLAASENLVNLHAEKTKVGNYGIEKQYERSKELLKNSTQTPNRALEVMIVPLQRNLYDMKATLRHMKASNAHPAYIKETQDLINSYENQINTLRNITGKDLNTQRQGALSLFAQNNKKSI